MFKIGEYQLLEVEEKDGTGFLLKESDGEKTVLLPNGEVIGEIEVGESVKVFLYLDTKDRLIATMKSSKISVNEMAYLEVVDLVDFGAFFDIGLQRDLFLPIKETNFKLKKNKKYLVQCYLDKSNRMCATTKVYDFLSTDHDFKSNDTVNGTVIRINPEVGVYVAIDNCYKGMIPINEYFEHYQEGDQVELRVIRVREDKKLDLSTKQLVKDQMVIDAERIYFELIKAGGRLNVHDKSDPQAIKEQFAMSKKAFKRAMGRLLKDEKIEMYETYIEKKEPLN